MKDIKSSLAMKIFFIFFEQKNNEKNKKIKNNKKAVLSPENKTKKKEIRERGINKIDKMLESLYNFKIK